MKSEGLHCFAFAVKLFTDWDKHALSFYSINVATEMEIIQFGIVLL